MQIVADPERLTQVLANLLINAARYSPMPGEISLRCNVGPDTLTVSVSDSGVGIKLEDIDKLFRLFGRLKCSTEDQISGLGVGLALSRSLIELHDGSIAVQSDGPGKGSCFTVRIPLNRSPARSVDQAQAISTRSGRDARLKR